jgi:hypothetical protein
VIFSEMTTITGLTHFCIRYTKTCQAINLQPLSDFLNSLKVSVVFYNPKRLKKIKKIAFSL